MSSHAGDSYPWLPYSLRGWRLNLFRLAHSAKCQNTLVTFSVFHFPLDLEWSPCSVLYFLLPQFPSKLSRQW